MLTPQDLGWLAGILEGEGCIGVNKDPRAGRTGYSLKVSVHNTDLLIVEVFRAAFAGSMWRHKGEQRKGNKPMFMWYVSGLRAGEILELLLPYMKGSKRTQAEVAILYARKYSGLSRRKRRTQGELAEQEQMYQHLRLLKRATA
jgi:hypothetical protein